MNHDNILGGDYGIDIRLCSNAEHACQWHNIPHGMQAEAMQCGLMDAETVLRGYLDTDGDCVSYAGMFRSWNGGHCDNGTVKVGRVSISVYTDADPKERVYIADSRSLPTLLRIALLEMADAANDAYGLSLEGWEEES